MDYDIKRKITLHGKALMKDAAFSITRLVIVYAIVGIVFHDRIDSLMILLMVLYGAVTLLSVRKRMRYDKKYYTFEPGNPAYDYLAELGSPDIILEEIDRQIRGGRLLYGELAKPEKTSPETIITEEYFIHLDKRAVIIPLSKIVCAYLYDHATKVSPPDSFKPTHFKPVFLIITYGEKKELYIRHTSIKYKEALAALDARLGCRLSYTRELGTLYNTDYPAFVKKVKEELGKKETE